VSGGYSTTDGALAEVSISERNFLGRGLFAKASVTYGQYARGYSLSFVEPYLLDYRVALGLDLFQRAAARQQLHLVRHQDARLQPAARLRPARRPVAAAALFDLSAEDLAAVTWRTVTTIRQVLLAFNPSPAFARAGGVDPTGNGSTNGLGCYSDGEASLPVRKELANGKTLTSSVGYSLNYNTLDNNKNPTDGLLVDFKQDFAGVGGDVSYLKSAVDAKYYTPLVADIVGLIHSRAAC
jgi:outer membrane protein insertion porin family